jgi:hypothetical protein
MEYQQQKLPFPVPERKIPELPERAAAEVQALISRLLVEVVVRRDLEKEAKNERNS